MVYHDQLSEAVSSYSPTSKFALVLAIVLRTVVFSLMRVGNSRGLYVLVMSLTQLAKARFKQETLHSHTHPETQLTKAYTRLGYFTHGVRE